MKRRCYIDPQFAAPLTAQGLVSFADFPAAFGALPFRPHRQPLLRTRTVPLPGDPKAVLYYKEYALNGQGWRFIGRSSKARYEFTNAARLADLGLPAVVPVAWGEERDALGRLHRSFIVTREIPDATTLEEFVRRHCPDRATSERRDLRDELARQLAAFVARMHAGPFFHKDLLARNLLITWEAPAPPRFWFIDCPRGSVPRFRPAFGSWRQRDLASLDKLGVNFFSCPERLQFMLRYLGQDRLDPLAKRLIRAVQAYRRTRWPAAWKGR